MTAGPRSAPGPSSRFDAFDCSGVLNEWLSPERVGATNLTDCANLIYHRHGGWGKRPGATRDSLVGSDGLGLVSGYRFYGIFPNPVTRLVVWNGTLLIGNDPTTLHPIGPYALTLSESAKSAGLGPDFCSMRDPQANNGNGADVLIITGLTAPQGSFAKGDITITGLPPQNIGTNAYISIQVTDGGSNIVATAAYQILPTDDPSSIAQHLVDLLNQSAAYLNKNGINPFIGASYFSDIQGRQTQGTPPVPQPASIVHLGARIGGGGGNNLTYGVAWGGDNAQGNASNPMGVVIGIAPNQTTVAPVTPPPSPLVYTSKNMVGGGNPTSGPLRWDSATGDLSALSYMTDKNDFYGCCAWHEHLFLWGDESAPDTVFASDIYQPSAFTFMEENGGMTGPINGGYTVDPGNGDPGIRCCKPNGNSLGLFKTANIYQMSGYDFQQGEYAFSITPQVVGYGIPSRDCVDVLEGQYVFWSGKKALRLAVGAYEPEHIGLPIPRHEGLASQGIQNVVKVVAGDFQIQTLLRNYFVDSGPGDPMKQLVILRSLALFAVDVDHDGATDAILVYDDEKTAMAGTYAWSIFNNWQVGCWIKYGTGRAATGTDTDKPRLYFVSPDGAYIYFVGNDPVTDWDNPIPWMGQTGFIDFGTPELMKNIHEFYLRVEATAGAKLVATVIPARIVLATPERAPYPTAPVTFTFSPTLAPQNGEALNNLKQFIQAALQTQAAMIQFTEDGTSEAAFELLSYGIDTNPQEAYQT